MCHGYGQLADRFIQQFARLDDGTRLIVAPEALSRYYLDPIPERTHQRKPRVGATWMTREDRDAEIADYVRYLDLVAAEVKHHLAGASPRIVVLGFSQGTATVSRWLAASELRADQLVLWSGSIPPELDLAAWAARLHGASITLVAGESDEFATPKQRSQPKRNDSPSRASGSLCNTSPAGTPSTTTHWKRCQRASPATEKQDDGTIGG